MPDVPDIDIGKLTRVVELVWDNKDAIVDLVTRLPILLGDAGEQMQTAGDGALTASRFLSGEVQSLTSGVADALDACHEQLERIADVLGDIGRLIGSVPLIGDVADPVADGLEAVSRVAANVDDVAARVRGLGGTLGGVGDGLGTMGGSLHGGGVALATLSGRPSAAATRKTAPRTRR